MKISHLKPFFKEQWKNYLVGIIFLIVIDFAQLLVPRITKGLADDYGKNILSFEGLIKYSMLMIAVGFFLMLGRYLWRVNIFVPARRLEYFLRDLIFKKILTLSPAFFTKNKTGDLMALATNDVNAIRAAAGEGIIMVVDSTFMMAFSIISMISVAGWRLSGYVFMVLPAIIIFVMISGKIIHKRFLKVQEVFGVLMDRVRENFSGIRVIKTFSHEALFEELFINSADEKYAANVKLIKVSAAIRPFIMFVAALSMFLVIRLGGSAVIKKEISLGDFIAFQMYLEMLIWPMMAFGMVINYFQRGRASLERINKLLEEEPDITDPCEDLDLDFESLEFKGVSYHYKSAERLVLNDISFSLKKGKSLAIIGSTGSGKSTIIKLLLRLYDLGEGDGGKILFNVRDLKEVSLKGMRENIGAVFQENFLFSETIEDNISFLETDSLVRPKIIDAAKLSDLHSNVENFPDGYQTLLGELGVTLSGGQKSRACLARAVYKNPKLLILDDAFSAVDTQTEERILNNLKSLEASIILISHRVSTVKNADEIIVLDDGKIVERGTDGELMKLRGEYYKLCLKQRLEDKVR